METKRYYRFELGEPLLDPMNFRAMFEHFKNKLLRCSNGMLVQPVFLISVSERGASLIKQILNEAIFPSRFVFCDSTHSQKHGDYT